MKKAAVYTKTARFVAPVKKSMESGIPGWGITYNWGAGMIRVFTAASFIKNNMPWVSRAFVR